MDPNDFPAPAEGFVTTHFLVVSDQDRSRKFYRSILGGNVVMERDPVITEPVDFGREIRAYVRDPDGHLIEVGQSRR